MIDHPDEMIPVVMGLITLAPGKTGTGKGSYWDITKSGQFEVHVTTHKYGTKLWALLPAGGKGGAGMWMIPPLGTEVFVSFDHGEIEADGGIIGMFGQPPGALAPGTILIIDDNVEVRSIGGVANKLPTLADVQAVVDKLNELIGKYNAHVHTLDTAHNLTLVVAVPSTVPTNAPDPDGTTVLKAE